jgi:hypothetical protein
MKIWKIMTKVGSRFVIFCFWKNRRKSLLAFFWGYKKCKRCILSILQICVYLPLSHTHTFSLSLLVRHTLFTKNTTWRRRHPSNRWCRESYPRVIRHLPPEEGVRKPPCLTPPSSPIWTPRGPRKRNRVSRLHDSPESNLWWRIRTFCVMRIQIRSTSLIRGDTGRKSEVSSLTRWTDSGKYSTRTVVVSVKNFFWVLREHWELN